MDAADPETTSVPDSGLRQIEDGGYEDPDEEEGSVLGASRERNEADPAEYPASKVSAK